MKRDEKVVLKWVYTRHLYREWGILATMFKKTPKKKATTKRASKTKPA